MGNVNDHRQYSAAQRTTDYESRPKGCGRAGHQTGGSPYDSIVAQLRAWVSDEGRNYQCGAMTQLTMLAGDRCADNQRLRFWISRNDLPFAQQQGPVGSERLESTGDLDVILEPRSHRVVWGGYFRFSTGGRFDCGPARALRSLLPRPSKSAEATAGELVAASGQKVG